MEFIKKYFMNYVTIPGMREEAKIAHSITTITRLVAHEMGIKYESLFLKSRKSDTVIARHFAMLLIRKHTPESLHSIGRYFGGKHHSTVIHGLKTIEDRIRLDEKVRAMFNKIETALLYY